MYICSEMVKEKAWKEDYGKMKTQHVFYYYFLCVTENASVNFDALPVWFEIE